MKRLITLFVVLGFSGCGGGTSGPTAPTNVDASGTWRGTITLTAATGGDCVGTAIASAVGTASATTNYSVAITQSGSSLSGTATSIESGATCQFAGNIGGSSITINTTVQSCSVVGLTGLRCANGALRDMFLVSDSYTGTVSGNTMTGTNASTYNVSSSLTGASAGVLTLQASFRFTR